MKFLVLNYLQATEYEPSEPTLAIRIFDPEGGENTPSRVLQPSKLWVAELHYTFADVDLGVYEEHDPETFLRLQKTGRCFDPLIAERLLKQFAEHRKKTSTVMVHCNAGLSRSPAVVTALCRRFKLTPEWSGRRTRGLMREMETRTVVGNPWVYHLLMDADYEVGN